MCEMKKCEYKCGEYKVKNKKNFHQKLAGCRVCSNKKYREEAAEKRYKENYGFVEGVYPKVMPTKYFSSWRNIWVKFREPLNERLFDLHVRTKIPMK